MANILSTVKNYLFPTPDNPLTQERPIYMYIYIKIK